MKGKDKKLIAVFVVPVVIIAAVAGYYLYMPSSTHSTKPSYL